MNDFFEPPETPVEPSEPPGEGPVDLEEETPTLLHSLYDRISFRAGLNRQNHRQDEGTNCRFLLLTTLFFFLKYESWLGLFIKHKSGLFFVKTHRKFFFLSGKCVQVEGLIED